MPSIFTKIIQGELPCHKIYENELTFAFLNITPNTPGHTLIVPKIEIDYYMDLPEEYYLEVFKVARIITPALEKATNCLRVGTKIQGLQVPHFHYHLIPLITGNEIQIGKTPNATEIKLRKMQREITQYL